jgi:hypothetical protein
MQRLIEQPTGDGDLLEGRAHLGRVHYHLFVYQRFSQVEDEPMPAFLDVEGRITSSDVLDLAALHQRRVELTLRLADGRLLDFSMVHGAGTIRSTGRGLYTPVGIS